MLTDDEEVKAMSAKSTDEQLKTSPKFKDNVTGAVVAVASDSTAMTEAAMANAELFDQLVAHLAQVLGVEHRNKLE